MAREPNPFTDRETFRIHESRPVLPGEATQPLRALSIGPGGRARRLPLQASEISAVVARVAETNKIELVRMDAESALSEVPDLRPLSSLRLLYLEAEKLRSYDGIGKPRSLERLLLVKYRESSLERFASSAVEFVRVAEGELRVFGLACDEVLLQGVRSLESFERSTVRVARVERCHRLALSTVANLRGLEQLEIRGRRSLESFEFLGECESIRSPVVTATPGLSRVDVSPIMESRSLVRVFLSVNDKRIATIAKASKGLTITNGSVCYVGEFLQDDCQAYYRA